MLLKSELPDMPFRRDSVHVLRQGEPQQERMQNHTEGMKKTLGWKAELRAKRIFTGARLIQAPAYSGL